MSVLQRHTLVADGGFRRALLTFLEGKRQAVLANNNAHNANGLLLLIAHLTCLEQKGALADDVRIRALGIAQSNPGETYRPGRLQSQLLEAVGTATAGWADAAEVFTELACCAIEDFANELRQGVRP